MENIRHYLSNIIIGTFQQLYPAVAIDSKLLELVYVGKFNTDYKIKSLIPVHKALQAAIGNNLPFTINELGYQLSTGLDPEHFKCTVDRGTLNINLTEKYVQNKIKQMLTGNDSSTMWLSNPENAKTKVLVDFSSPNIAKDMHVGHLRSTIIGDSIATLYELLGYDVYRINHIGDFGLQFGMIIQHLLEKYPSQTDYQEAGLAISDLQNFYKEAKKRFDTDPEFAKAAHSKVVLLQTGDKEIVDAWNFIKDISRLSYNNIYDKLGIRLEEQGESFYQDMIPDVIAELTAKGLVIESDGRKIIQVPGYEIPLTLQKTNGGYTYDTTDLAAIRHRLVDLGMDKVYYVIDSGQSLHCELFFKVAELAGWKKPHQVVKHIGFGVVLGEDGKKFKSRAGDTVKLDDLLQEAVTKAQNVLKEHRGGANDAGTSGSESSLTQEQHDNIIKSVAYGSLKYADLSSMRTNNYKFSHDRMISFKGNTGTYQLYEYVRICTILENAKDYLCNIPAHIAEFSISEKEELDICKTILLFPDVIDNLSDDLMFHNLCAYLYDLSNVFSAFHTKCRCIHYNKETKKEIIKVDYNRIMICLATQSIIGYCFSILGLRKLNKM